MKKILGFVATLLMVGGCVATTDREPSDTLGEAGQAVISNDVSASFVLDGCVTTITTGEMPRGWILPTTTKSPITVDWSIPGLSSTPDANCHPAMNGTFSSIDGIGTLSYVLSPSGKPIGYWWAAQHDLAPYQNHWHNHFACDGSVRVVGCTNARKVSYTLSVGGACLAAGGTCAAAETVSLPSVQDADVVDTNCAVECPESLGTCINDCHKERCPNGGPDCIRCCECYCKYVLHTKHDVCEAPQESCFEDKPNAPACL